MRSYDHTASGEIDLTADSRRVSVDGRKRYEHGSVDADQLIRFR